MRAGHAHGKVAGAAPLEIGADCLQFVRSRRHLFHGIINNFSGNAARDGAAVIAPILGVGFVGPPAALVGLAAGDLAMQPFHVVAALDKFRGQPV